MIRGIWRGFSARLSLLAIAACSDSAPSSVPAPVPEAGSTFDVGETLTVPLTGPRVLVKLASPPASVTPQDPWDLAFEGVEVYTNSGPSGPGASAAFGPIDPIAFLEDVAPDVPFLASDKSGGAFVRWYFYEGAPTHALYSRFHVFGVKDGSTLYRVQVLGYYGKRDGVTVSGLYRVLYGEVGQEPREAIDLDGSVAGGTGTAETPSECLDLGSGVRTMLTPAAARASSAWHLCFRREDISVNGEVGGPRGIAAVDFDADRTATEKLAEVIERTAESERARFDDVTAQSFDNQPLRGDRVISSFSGLWTVRGANPLAPSNVAWLTVGGNGKSRYLVGFPRFEGATATSPGVVTMRVKAVK